MPCAGLALYEIVGKYGNHRHIIDTNPYMCYFISYISYI